MNTNSIQIRKLDGSDLVELLVKNHKLSQAEAEKAYQTYLENVRPYYDNPSTLDGQAAAIAAYHSQKN
jgi:hypothetical protein